MARSTMQWWKTRERTSRHEEAGVNNAGVENANGNAGVALRRRLYILSSRSAKDSCCAVSPDVRQTSSNICLSYIESKKQLRQ